MAEYKASLLKNHIKNEWVEVDPENNMASIVATYKEIQVVADSSSLGAVISGHVMVDTLTNTAKTFIIGGWHNNASDYGVCYVQLSTSGVGVKGFFKNGVTQTTTWKYYARK